MRLLRQVASTVPSTKIRREGTLHPNDAEEVAYDMSRPSCMDPIDHGTKSMVNPESGDGAAVTKNRF